MWGSVCKINVTEMFLFFRLRIKKLGMNTYLYAPKDDLKHRALWRDLYSPEETGKLDLDFLK